MKTIFTILLVASMTCVTAQNKKPNTKTNSLTATVNKAEKTIAKDTVAINTKGIKKIEEIIIEDLSKHIFLDLMLLRKTKKIIC